MKPNSSLPTQGSQTPLADILRPLQEFIRHSASSGIILLVVTVVALIFANTRLAGAYHDVLHTEISFTLGTLELSDSLLHWINDGLMAIFFLLVGLEIKREVLVGELSNLRAALLPIVAAVGGALVPAVIYALLNAGGQGEPGWGIPMATDIAFTLGLLALLGKRVPAPLKIFLTAIAIMDDLIAIVVIAVFYSAEINLTALGLGCALLAAMILANVLGIRTLFFYLGMGVIVWLAFLQSGVHATIAGVLVALTIPARNRIDSSHFLEQALSLLDHFRDSRSASAPMLSDDVKQEVVVELEDLSRQVQSPLQRLEHALSPWVAFLVMPVFAIANAGVTVAIDNLAGETSSIALGIVFGLVVGKPLGLLIACWLLIRSGIAALPQGLRWGHLVGAAFLAGIGFTMSLFIASLSFGEGELLEVAKLGILAASLLAGGVGFFLLRRMPTPTA